MQHLGRFGLALGLFVSTSAWAQDPADPRRDADARENAATVAARERARIARERAVLDALRVEAEARITVRFAGDARPVILESAAPAIPRDADDLEEAPEPAPAPARRPVKIRNSVLARENFDRWLYGEASGEEERLTHLARLLKAKAGRATRALGLTEPERSKLELAGRGDIKRLLDRIEAERREFEESRKVVATGRTALRQLGPLAAEFRDGPFGEGSLFAKTLRKIEADRPPGP